MLVPILCIIIAILGIALGITTVGWILSKRELKDLKMDLSWNGMKH